MSTTLQIRALPLLLTIAIAIPLHAQEWSLGVGTGPFIFGHFAERTLRAGTEQGVGNKSTVIMSARTRAGLSVDLERNLGSRFAIRVEGAATESPIAIKTEGGGAGVALDAGKIDVTTLIAPLVFRINPRGSLRFNLFAGPAYTIYHVRRRAPGIPQIAVFEGTRQRWGAAAGGGAEWWWSSRFAVEGRVADVASDSPFRRTDFAASALVRTPRVHNVHTTIGLRWKF